MKRFAPIASTLLCLSGCGEEPRAPRLPIEPTDATFLEIGPIDLRRDGSTDAAVVDSSMPTDAASDAGLPGCSVVDTTTIVSAESGSTFSPVITIDGEVSVVGWVETRAAFSDVYVRRFPSSGAPGTEFRLTNDATTEGDLALAPSDDDFLLAYRYGGLGSDDVATLAFDPVSLTFSGANDLTSDLDADSHPALVPAIDSFHVLFARTTTTSDVGRITVSTAGAPITAYADTNATRSFDPPFVVDATSGDVRVFHRASSTTIESFRLGADGVAATPDDVPRTTTFGVSSLGDELHTTAANATPRALLVRAAVSARASAFVTGLGATGTALATPVEVDTRTISDADVTAHGGVILVAYRTTDAMGPAIRLRGFSSTGVRMLDQRLASISGAAGSIAIGEFASGTLLIVEDEAVGLDRELRALRVDCPF